MSLDDEDGDLARFLTYLVAALQRLAPNLGANLLRALQSPLPHSPEPLLTDLLNAIALLPDDNVVIKNSHPTDGRVAVHYGSVFVSQAAATCCLGPAPP